MRRTLAEAVPWSFLHRRGREKSVIERIGCDHYFELSSRLTSRGGPKIHVRFPEALARWFE
jgi:hypothetical protein